MQHDLSIRKNKDDKVEVIVSLELADKWDEVEVNESIVACAFKHIIIRANDAGRSVMKGEDYRDGKKNDDDVKKAVLSKFEKMLTLQKYEFRTKGQALSKVEKNEKTMKSMSDEELLESEARLQAMKEERGIE